MSSPIHVRSQLVPLARRYLAERGLASRGPAPIVQDGDGETWEISALQRFFDDCEALSKNRWLGLELAGSRRVGSHGVIEFLWRSSSTVREALNELVSHSRLLNEVSQMELDEGERAASFVQRVAHAGGMGRHANEFFVAMLVREFRALVSPDFAPRRVRFAHRRPRLDPTPLVAAVGTASIVWDDVVTGIELDARWLDAKIATADRALLETLRAHARAWLPWVAAAPEASLTRRLGALLRTSKRMPSLDAAARRLGVSARTLQRQLADQGHTFHSVRDAILAERVRALLEKPNATVKEVAARMGYASPTTFVRAFRRWTGTTPAAWRSRASDD